MPQKSEKPRFFYGYVVLAASFTIWLIAYGISQSYTVFFKPLLTEFGWSRAETVSAFAMYSIFQALLSVAMGWLTDKLGPRKVVLAFGSFIGIAYFLLSQISSLWQFQLYYLLVAIGLSTASIPVMATIARWFIKKRGLMTGIVQTGVGIGGFLFAPLSGWIITSYGWRYAYAVLGAIALVGIAASGLLIKRDPRDVGQYPDGSTAIKAAPNAHPVKSVQAKGLNVLQAMHTGQFWIILGIYFSFGFCRSTFMPHIAAHVQDLGFTLADGANVAAVLTLASVPGRFWINGINNRTAFMIGFAVTTVTLIWGAITGELWGLYLFAVLFGLGWGAQAVLRYTTAASAFGLASVGFIMGIFGLAEAGASALGSYLAGYLFDVLGTYQPAFFLGIAISVAGIILCWRLKPAYEKM